jgi:guanylate kinase
VKEHFPRACFIFVLPPNLETLEQRLVERGTEQASDVEQRLEDSSRELLEESWYDYSIVNDVLEEAVEELAAIILSARRR